MDGNLKMKLYENDTFYVVNHETNTIYNDVVHFHQNKLEEALKRNGSKKPTTMKWVEGWKADDAGGRFVRCRLVGRDFKPRSEESREDLFAAMPPLEAKKLMFRMTAGLRGWMRKQGKPEMKLMFIDVRKAHLSAICEEEAWVELPEECW